MEKKGFLAVGKIVGAHGVKGNLKVHSYAESLSIFEQGSSILVASAKGFEKLLTIRWVKPHGRVVLFSLKGIENRHLAETLIGSELYVKRDSLPKLEDGSYYWFDIIGLSVFTNNDTYIGRVESIIDTGSNDVYVVKDIQKDGDNEILIPAIESVVLTIDLNQKKMIVDLPEGL
ncbi:MAG: 16S rRNA processing protein RimM [Desulfobacterales bacterium]|nr:MAG: 16S rRNA processing protein RimM [Desulfobacterales bacterium]